MSLGTRCIAAACVGLALLLAGCEREPVGRGAPVQPREQRMVFPNFSLKALPWNEWKIEQGNRDRIVVTRTRDRNLMRLRAEEFRLPAGEGQSFAAWAEAREEAAHASLEPLSVHYDIDTLAGAQCLRYDGAYRDPAQAGSADEFLTRKGYVCEHPTRPGIAAQVDFSVASPTRSPRGIEALLRQADEVFESVVFTNAR